jgi:hypothetical protein
LKKLIVFIFLLAIFGATAQTKLNPTDQFSVEGKVRHPVVFTIAALDTFKAKSIPDIVITNHSGAVKNNLTRLKGVSLKDILSTVALDANNSKILSEFYFVFVATDNYKFVFSWNEIFNTETGNNIYIITEEGGKKIGEMNTRIPMICTTDFKTGRRDLKNLQKVIVARVE